MFKTLRLTKDTYITNKIVSDNARTGANVGQAASLDLFKLYGMNEVSGSALTELSRLLVKFDLEPLRELYESQKIDITDPTFNVTLKLFDVYGGQPTPANFAVSVYPMSRLFDEGNGRDIVKYADTDACNWVTASYLNNLWEIPGAGGGGINTASVDYITELSGGISLLSTQNFVTGEEDLCIDVTTAVSATLAGLIPDEGFRISFSESFESDTRTYFVKRFAARNAYNEDKHPTLVTKVDDSIQDDTQILELDTNSNLFLYNYRLGSLENLLSASNEVIGSECLRLKLTTPISGGTHDLWFTGSQFQRGLNSVTGIYSASVNIPADDAVVIAKLAETGSVDFTPIWTSSDETTTFVTGSRVTFNPPTRVNFRIEHSGYTVTATGLRTAHRSDEQVIVRVNIFDYTSPKIKLVKCPLILPGLVIRDVHYQVRDRVTNEKVIPFDTKYKSTRCSSDGQGMYFELDTSNLRDQRTYAIDVMIDTQGSQYIYRDVSPDFRINDLHT